MHCFGRVPEFDYRPRPPLVRWCEPDALTRISRSQPPPLNANPDCAIASKKSPHELIEGDGKHNDSGENMIHYGTLRDYRFSDTEAAKDDIRGSKVYGRNDEKLGKIDDVI